MATIKTDRFPAKGVHAGVNAVSKRISLSVSFSLGDIYNVGKLPHGAVVLDAKFVPGAASPVGLVFKAGTSISQEAFFASLTYSIATAGLRGLGTRYQISLSDDATVRFDNVTFIPTAGVSIGHVGDLILLYSLDNAT